MAVRRVNLGNTMLTLLAAILLAMPVITSQNQLLLHTLIMTGLAIILATSNRLVYLTGLVHFGHIAFYAMGAYTAVLLVTKLDVSFWFAFPIAGVLAGTIALAFAAATSKVKGFYFTLLTLAFVEVVRLTITFAPALGAAFAMKCPPPNPITIPHLFTIGFATRVEYYYFVLVLLAIMLVVLYLIENSRVGAALSAIAQSEPLAESIGINATRHKVLTFSTCAVFAGLAGAFYAPYAKVIGPSNFTVLASVIIWFQIVVGGAGSFWGPVIGAVSLVFLREYLPGTGAIKNIYYAVAVLAAVFFLPGGLVSLPRVVRQKGSKGMVALRLREKLSRRVCASLVARRKKQGGSGDTASR
jgi:branched-chain amino acid transport system permease protein